MVDHPQVVVGGGDADRCVEGCWECADELTGVRVQLHHDAAGVADDPQAPVGHDASGRGMRWRDLLYHGRGTGWIRCPQPTSTIEAAPRATAPVSPRVLTRPPVNAMVSRAGHRIRGVTGQASRCSRGSATPGRFDELRGARRCGRTASSGSDQWPRPNGSVVPVPTQEAGVGSAAACPLPDWAVDGRNDNYSATVLCDLVPTADVASNPRADWPSCMDPDMTDPR